MDGLFIIGVLVLGGVLIAAAGHADATAGMDDRPVDINQVRKGVARGWYEAALTRVHGKPAIRLSGKLANGETYQDVFPITQDDFDQLQSEGYLIVLYNDEETNFD